MNVSIVGLNQLYDVEIDKINKPYLPLASGEMTQSQASHRLLESSLPRNISKRIDRQLYMNKLNWLTCLWD